MNGCLKMSDSCPRQITFELAGNPGVIVTATENETGGIDFTVDVEDTAAATGDLRALFMHFNEAKLPGLQITGGDGLLTESKILKNNVLDLGDGATLAGAVKKGFDIGLEWGTPGAKKDDIHDPVHFTLSRAQGDLTLDDIATQLFGAKLDAVGGPGGPRNGATKLTGEAPYAPDAKDDAFSVFEDGAAGLNSPSKTPTAVTLDVLGNDTDGDGQSLIVTSVHEGPGHGTVTISADGKTISYTPDLDYSGPDSFEYCVSDGNGGQDSAVCTIDVKAVADTPVISWTVAPGANVNEAILNVTVTENDADGSEFIDDLVLSVAGGVPLGASIDPTSVNPAGTPDQIVQQFVVKTAPETDYDFDIDITATSQEASNADQQAATSIQNIEVDFTHNQETLTYSVVDQSIWDTGDEFQYHAEPFFGIDTTIDEAGGDPDVTDTYYDVFVHLKTGFQATIDFSAGDIDATLPLDVTIDTTYNKTTDQVLITPTLALGQGMSFVTHGPEGSFKLDFKFLLDAEAKAELLGVDLIDIDYFADKTTNILDLDSQGLAVDFNPIPGVVSVHGEWPHISVTGGTSGSGESNEFLNANLDVDALANMLLGGGLFFLDPEPLNPDNFELLDVDIEGSLKLLQEFSLDLLATQKVNLVLEDGHVEELTFGQQLLIDNASSHDLNNDGIIEFSFDFSPKVNLTNDTDIGVDVEMHLAVGKNAPLVGTIYEDTFDIYANTIDVYDNTFQLAGVGTKSFDFVI